MGAIAEPVCPYCRNALKKEPKRRTCCPSCGNYIYVRSDPEIFASSLLKADDAFALDLFRQISDHGATKPLFDSTRNELLQRRGKEPFPSEIIWLMARRAAEQARDLQDSKCIYYQMALFLNQMGRDAMPVLERAARAELLWHKSEGVKKVEISVCMGDACRSCRKLNGKRLPVDEALRLMPIPCKACTFELYDDGHGFCRCSYDMVL